jgi:hypothetical protein
MFKERIISKEINTLLWNFKRKLWNGEKLINVSGGYQCMAGTASGSG